MRSLFGKSIAVASAALVLGLGVAAATSTAAEAQGWRHGYYGGGYYWGPAVGLGILGLAAGAAIASQGPYYGPGPYYGYGPGPGGCSALEPVYDRWGRYLGRRWVNVCQ